MTAKPNPSATSGRKARGGRKAGGKEAAASPSRNESPDIDIPYWFISFARHILRVCNSPGVYHITLDIPSNQRRPREIEIAFHQRLRMALLDTEPERQRGKLHE